MSDIYFDALREAGEYPPKGYGWKSDEEQKRFVQRYVDAGHLPPWVIEEARRHGIKLEEAQ